MPTQVMNDIALWLHSVGDGMRSLNNCVEIYVHFLDQLVRQTYQVQTKLTQKHTEQLINFHIWLRKKYHLELQ